jgi:hypothetical protein
MSLKRDAVKDVLCVVAYGTLEARNVAINLLVYYWPHTNSTLYDRRSINFKFNGKLVLTYLPNASINSFFKVLCAHLYFKGYALRRTISYYL